MGVIHSSELLAPRWPWDWYAEGFLIREGPESGAQTTRGVGAVRGWLKSRVKPGLEDPGARPPLFLLIRRKDGSQGHFLLEKETRDVDRVEGWVGIGVGSWESEP